MDVIKLINTITEIHNCIISVRIIYINYSLTFYIFWKCHYLLDMNLYLNTSQVQRGTVLMLWIYMTLLWLRRSNFFKQYKTCWINSAIENPLVYYCKARIPVAVCSELISNTNTHHKKKRRALFNPITILNFSKKKKTIRTNQYFFRVRGLSKLLSIISYT